MLRRNSGFENFPNRWGIAELSRRQESTENGAQTTTSLSGQGAVTCTFYENQAAHASYQHVTLCNCGGLPASTRTLKNPNHTVDTHRSMLKTSPPWLHRHGTPPRTGNGMPNVPVELLQPQKQLFITGEVLSEAGRSQRKGFHSTDRFAHAASYIHTVVRQRDPPSHTRVGLQALLDRLPGFPRGCERP